MRKILFIINSKAGKTEFDIRKEDIEKVFKKAGRLSEIEVVYTRYKDHTKYLIQAFDSLDYSEKIVIVCGGDGSLNELVNICYGKNISIGLIPTGTANDFAKNFDYENFRLEKLLNFKIKPIDLIKVNNSLAINIVSLGFDTKILKKAYDYLEEKPSLGKRAYIRSVIYNLKNISSESLRLDLKLVDQSHFSLKGDYMISALCNGGFYGSGFNPAPKARVDDGYLNLVLAKKLPLIKFIPLAFKYKKGDLEGNKNLKEIKVKSGLISSNKEFLANSDGEIFKTKKLEFEIIEKAIGWVYFN